MCVCMCVFPSKELKACFSNFGYFTRSLESFFIIDSILYNLLFNQIAFKQEVTWLY